MAKHAPVEERLSLQVFPQTGDATCFLCKTDFITELVSPVLDQDKPVCPNCLKLYSPFAYDDLVAGINGEAVGMVLRHEESDVLGYYFVANELLRGKSVRDVMALASSPNQSMLRREIVLQAKESKPHVIAGLKQLPVKRNNFTCDFWHGWHVNGLTQLPYLFPKKSQERDDIERMTGVPHQIPAWTMTNETRRKVLLGANCDRMLMNHGFRCIGHLAEITDNLNHERLWLWCDEKGVLVVSYDEGNGFCHVTSVIDNPMENVA